MKSWESTHFSVITVHFADGWPAEGYTDCDKVSVEQGVLQFDVYRPGENGTLDSEIRGYSLVNIRSYEIVRGVAKPEVA